MNFMDMAVLALALKVQALTLAFWLLRIFRGRKKWFVKNADDHAYRNFCYEWPSDIYIIVRFNIWWFLLFTCIHESITYVVVEEQ